MTVLVAPSLTTCVVLWTVSTYCLCNLSNTITLVCMAFGLNREASIAVTVSDPTSTGGFAVLLKFLSYDFDADTNCARVTIATT